MSERMKLPARRLSHGCGFFFVSWRWKLEDIKQLICGPILTTNHRALQSKALELERQRATDNLKKGLQHRPDRETLVERMSIPSCIVSSLHTPTNLPWIQVTSSPPVLPPQLSKAIRRNSNATCVPIVWRRGYNTGHHRKSWSRKAFWMVSHSSHPLLWSRVLEANDGSANPLQRTRIR